jgi:hypothetical protein
MTTDELKKTYDWTRVRPELRERVILAVAAGWDSIVACTGRPQPQSIITYCRLGYISWLDAGCFAIRRDESWADEIEETIATPTNG